MKAKKSAKQIRREVDDFLRTHRHPSARHHASKATKKSAPRAHGADTWDVAMDALLEDDASRAARLVRTVRTEYGITVPPTKDFSRTVREIPESTRRAFFEHLGEIDLEDVSIHDSLFKKTEWRRDAMQRLPVGTRVRVVRSDLDEYIGLKGTVTGYDLGGDGAWPGVRVKIGASTDTFFANGEPDDEIVRDKSNG